MAEEMNADADLCLPSDNGSDQRKRRLSETAAGGTDCDYEIFPVPGTQKVLYGV